MESVNAPQRECPNGCPFQKMPANFWNQLIKPPFRKRHPIIFWFLVFLAVTLCFSYINSFFEDEDDNGQERIGVVSIDGVILDSTVSLHWINQLIEKPHVKGILVRINSPGGGAAASQEIYYALKRAAKKKSVVVSMGAAAASGGLMISMAGNRIFASPSTVTGSIGVRMDIPQLQGLLDKFGIGQETLVSGKFKDVPSYTHPMSSEDRKYLQGVVNDMYEQFVEIVATNRKMDIEKARSIADGKIYTGQQALKLGLIDELGGRDDALAWICDKTRIPFSRNPLVMPVKKNRIREFIFKDVMGLDNFATISQELARVLEPAFLYR